MRKKRVPVPGVERASERLERRDLAREIATLKRLKLQAISAERRAVSHTWPPHGGSAVMRETRPTRGGEGEGGGGGGVHGEAGMKSGR